ncbi:MAG TPA: hypothetical protein VFL91_30570 [Thermomicrobiales bacterium]|nr:hypothetical protein [Thermomicrobiales bacterium]
MEQHEQPRDVNGLSAEELAAEEAVELPERESLSLINPFVTARVDAIPLADQPVMPGLRESSVDPVKE